MYYLHHYFNPDFSHINLTPHTAPDGSVDYRYLGYVQNVIRGQVLAEVIDIEAFPDTKRDPRFIYKERHLPIGANTALHETTPDTIIAIANGYVFYHDGCICVKKLLNIRGNVGFHTGNIFFVGDLAVHGDIQTDFAVHAKNILVKQHIESAKVKATGAIVCMAGVKGTSLDDKDHIELESEALGAQQPVSPTIPSTLLDAEEDIRLPFCEQVQIRAKGNVIIDGSCLHSIIYVGGNLIIKGRLQGGCVYANGTVYVEKQLGCDYTTTTKIMMGYDPFRFLLVQKLESQIRYLNDKITYFQHQVDRNSVMEQEFAPRLELAQKKLSITHARRNAIWRDFDAQGQETHCRILVPGTVMPGCEIGIGKAYYTTDTSRSDVMFRLYSDDIICTSPAMAAPRAATSGAP